MTNHEAKFTLNAYRPSGRDAADPAMAGALQQAKSDPGLHAWFARAQSHDLAVASKLREITPPAGLREALLAGGKASNRNIQTRSLAWFWLAAAAAIVVLLGAVSWWRLAPIRGGTLDEFAANFVARGFMLEKRSADLTELKAWLAEKHGPLPATLPAKFAALQALGCRSLNFQGRDVSLVCFERGGKEFHVFVARRDDFPARPGITSPEFAQRGKLATATWSDATNHYVLVSAAGLEAVKTLL